MRLMVLREEPLCRDPYGEHEGRPTPATDVDHIIPLRQGGTHERGNLQSLCGHCHTLKTNKLDGGGWPLAHG